MKAISLFSGVGGFELGFDRAGIETVLQVENDAWCQSVLERHWPEVQRLDDVRNVDAATFQGRRRDVVADGAGTDAERLGGAARGAAGVDHRADGSGRLQHDGRRGNGHDADAERKCLDSGGIDLVYGGFPCQDVSVAGKRAGFRGERSGLWHEFYRVLCELRPRWCVIENVPGLFSSGRGRDFGLVLRALVDVGYGVAWRVLDARWFGVPQRRRRVFIVGCLGDAPRAAQVLAVCESCGGHPQTRSETPEDVAPTPDDGARGASVELPMIPAVIPLDARQYSRGDKLTNHRASGSGGAPGTGVGKEGDPAFTVSERGQAIVAATLSGGGHPESNMPGRHHEDDDNLIVGSVIDEGQARPLVARATGYRMDLESETFVVSTNGSDVQTGDMPGALSTSQRVGHGDFVVASTFSGGEVDDQAPALVSGDGPHGRSTFNGMDVVIAMNNGQGEPNVSTDGTAFALQADAHSYVASPVRASDGHHGWSGGRGDGADNLVAFQPTGGTRGVNAGDTSPPIKIGTGIGAPAGPAISGSSGVRRLTPLECERLQGWPDDWTRYTADDREIPDSHRYRMIGNGVVATVAEWVGHRLVEADSWQ